MPGKGYGLQIKEAISRKDTVVIAAKAIFVHLATDQRSKLDMFKRKLQDQPDLIAQVQRLFSKPQYAQKRSELIKQINPIELMNRPISMELTSAVPTMKDVSDQQLQSTFHKNEFGNDEGDSLEFLSSLFNHSCLPNCHSTFIGDLLVVRAAGPIQTGTELTLIYNDVRLLPFGQRRAKLRSWFDHCSCQICEPFHGRPELIGQENELFETTETIRTKHETNTEANTVTSVQLINQIKELDETIERWIDTIHRISNGTKLGSDSFELSDSPLSVSLVKPYRLQRTLIQQLIESPKFQQTNKQTRQWQARKTQISNKLEPILRKYYID